MTLDRRTLLGGSIATAALVTAGCAGGTGTTTTGGQTPTGTADNPFGVTKGSTVDAYIFNGGYGTDYVDYAGARAAEKTGITVKVTQSNQIAQELQPRFVAGDPPDVIDNSGAGSIGMATIVDQLEDLTQVLEAPSYEGTKIADTVYVDAIKKAGTYNGKLAAINYAVSIYALWYSASLFRENGWTPPTTYAEAMELGAKAKAKGKYLFLFGKEAATYYLTTAISSAIKEGGDEVRLAFEKLDPGCYSQPTVVEVFKAWEEIIKAGYMKPGGSGTQFTAAQAQWSNGQEALLYPSGGWIENEMRSQTKDGFEMTGTGELVLTSSPKLGVEALRSAPGEPFIVPSKAKNKAGGLETLRAMLSKDAAANFSKTKRSLTVVKGALPADGSTGLKSQETLFQAAGTKTFDYRFIAFYGINRENLVVMNSFLEGTIDAATARKQLQEIVDKVANDPNVKKLEV